MKIDCCQQPDTNINLETLWSSTYEIYMYISKNRIEKSCNHIMISIRVSFSIFSSIFSQSSVVAAAEKHQTHFSSHDCIASIRWFQMPFFFFLHIFLVRSFFSFLFILQIKMFNEHWALNTTSLDAMEAEKANEIQSKAMNTEHTRQKPNSCGMKWISIWLWCRHQCYCVYSWWLFCHCILNTIKHSL